MSAEDHARFGTEQGGGSSSFTTPKSRAHGDGPPRREMPPPPRPGALEVGGPLVDVPSAFPVAGEADGDDADSDISGLHLPRPDVRAVGSTETGGAPSCVGADGDAPSRATKTTAAPGTTITAPQDQDHADAVSSASSTCTAAGASPPSSSSAKTSVAKSGLQRAQESLSLLCEMIEKQDLSLQLSQRYEKALQNEVEQMKQAIAKSLPMEKLKKICGELRTQTKELEARTVSLKEEEVVKREEMERCIEEQILPLQVQEDEQYEIDRKEQEELKGRLSNFIEEYRKREEILAQRDRVRDVEFEKVELQIARMDEQRMEEGCNDEVVSIAAIKVDDLSTAKQALRLSEAERRNKQKEAENAERKARIDRTFGQFEEWQAAMEQLHKDFQATANELQSMRAKKQVLEGAIRLAKKRGEETKELLKRKKVLAKLVAQSGGAGCKKGGVDAKAVGS